MPEADQHGPHRAIKRRPNLWFRIAGLFAALSVAFYLLGAFFMLRLENDYHTCTEARFGMPDGPGLPPFVRLDDRFFPPGALCRWEDGYSLDLVPSFAAPMLLIYLAISATAALVAVVNRHKSTTGQ